jgi:CheY-like chemotaxis protein
VGENRKAIYLSAAITSFFNERTFTSDDLSVMADDQHAACVCPGPHSHPWGAASREVSRPRVPEHEPSTGRMGPFIEKPRRVTFVWVLLPRMDHIVLMVGHGCGRFACYVDDLRAAGFRIMTASDAKEAVRLVTALRPSLGVIDVSTLGETGWEICGALRATRVSRSTPVLVMADATGATLRAVKARARHLDCTVLPQAMKRDELVDFVAAVIGLSG